MPDKISDNDIKKALEICQGPHDNDTCNNCKYKRNFGCRHALCNDILDLINRLEAENERLTAENKLLIDNDVSNKYPNCVLVEKGRIYTRTLEDYEELIGDISAEAYKECIEKVKAEIKSWTYNLGIYTDKRTAFERLENFLKEMVGETK